QVYPNKPAWQRFVTIFAGPFANYVFAILMIAVVYAVAGIETERDPDRVSEAKENYPAAGKIESGDRILSVNGQTTDGFQRFKDEAQKAKGAPVTIRLLRRGQEHEVHLTPVQDPKSREWRVGIGFGYVQRERV